MIWHIILFEQRWSEARVTKDFKRLRFNHPKGLTGPCCVPELPRPRRHWHVWRSAAKWAPWQRWNGGESTEFLAFPPHSFMLANGGANGSQVPVFHQSHVFGWPCCTAFDRLSPSHGALFHGCSAFPSQGTASIVGARHSAAANKVDCFAGWSILIAVILLIMGSICLFCLCLGRDCKITRSEVSWSKDQLLHELHVLWLRQWRCLVNSTANFFVSYCPHAASLLQLQATIVPSAKWFTQFTQCGHETV